MAMTKALEAIGREGDGSVGEDGDMEFVDLDDLGFYE